MDTIYDGVLDTLTRFGPYADWQYIGDGVTLKPKLTEDTVKYDDVPIGKSIWGVGNEQVMNYIDGASPCKNSLDIGGGDGRYKKLVEKTEHHVVTDIDERALAKYILDTAHEFPEHLSKLETLKHDITTNFPVKDGSFDRIFSAGILHLFPKEKLKPVADEIYRMLETGGEFVLDFPTNIVRTQPDGELLYYADEPRYTLEGAKEDLSKIFSKDKYSIEIFVSHHSDPKGTFRESEHPYNLECDYLLLRAKKL